MRAEPDTPTTRTVFAPCRGLCVVSRTMQTTTRLAAANIRAELGRQNKSRAALARDLDVTEMWLSRRMTGKTEFTIDELARIADTLGVGLTTLLTENKASA